MSNSETRPGSSDQFFASFPSFVVNSLMTLILWIFGLAVFIPIGSVVKSTPSIVPLIALIFFTATAYFTWKTLQSGKIALDSYFEMTTSDRRRSEQKLIFSKNVGYIALAIFGSVIITPLVWWINPVFGGIAIVVTLVSIVFLVLPLVGDIMASFKKSPERGRSARSR